MTNRNSSWKNKPFLLHPAGKDYLWGGTRLIKDFGKHIFRDDAHSLLMEPLAETWECSTHPDGLSIVASGEYQGYTLSEVLRKHPEYLGTHPRTKAELPILIKLIDAKEDLSVQVHPDDEYAKSHENGAMGKSEMWYVLDAAEGTELIYGFRNDITEETLKESLESHTIEKYVQKVKVSKDDVFFVEAGIVHAIGAGALIVEIQENSNLTYRLYDYQRVDRTGQPRELHIEKALQVINRKSSIEPRQPMRVLRYKPGCARELLCRCKYFQVERLLLQTEELGERNGFGGVEFSAGENSFQVLLCVDGQGRLQEKKVCGTECSTEDSLCIDFKKGDCIFVPADSIRLELNGKAQMLQISC
ncbi:MAG: class I mannose-6-phosphate isomerase [Lachnospiraceae bacterium]|nr:class I mannose-6-phosphate isomerase [Lachnospiraceae bacterium]